MLILILKIKKQSMSGHVNNNSKVLVTGGNGFISGYLIEELLSSGYKVVAIDNFSKYGQVKKTYDSNENYQLIEGDVKDTNLLYSLMKDCDHLVAGAAMIGGISYFHEFAYDLIAENERIIASTFDAAIESFKTNNLKKITVLSSSMVYESSDIYPTPEGAQLTSAPPLSTYGFQKLSVEYFAKGAYEQYKLPYTIVRPFNCIGIGEKRAKNDADIKSGNIKLALSHVVPDIIQKIAKGQNPLHILGNGNQIRHYTYGGDLAKGIKVCMEHENALNNDFNISTSTSTTVNQLCQSIWNKMKLGEELKIVNDDPYTYDVQKRVPSTEKAKNLLGYTADTSLDESLDEIIPWVVDQVRLGEM